MSDALSTDKIEAALSKLPEWGYTDGKLTKDFKFKHFKEAFSFLTRVAFEAEGMQHHPEIHNVYNNVTISLCTHDAGDKVTQKDLDLAQAIEHFNWK